MLPDNLPVTLLYAEQREPGPATPKTRNGPIHKRHLPDSARPAPQVDDAAFAPALNQLPDGNIIVATVFIDHVHVQNFDSGSLHTEFEPPEIVGSCHPNYVPVKGEINGRSAKHLPGASHAGPGINADYPTRLGATDL